jgi:heme/copper-type cytochrome/quinol oxidase subunit 3
MSSLMMALAVNAIQKGNLRSMRWSLLTTIVFGCIFLGCQVFEFTNFVNENHMTITNSIFGTTFFTLTGTHGTARAHRRDLAVLAYSFTGRLTQRDAIDVEAMGLYWHFVDIVWIVIFTAVYLLEYL